jgi:hypothetical protein
MTPATTPAQAPPAADTAIAMLEVLGAELLAAGLSTRLVIQPGAVPVLLVTNPEASQLRERIAAAPLEGTWQYWWSWAEPIDTTPAAAAAAIRRVLAAAPAAPGGAP